MKGCVTLFCYSANWQFVDSLILALIPGLQWLWMNWDVEDITRLPILFFSSFLSPLRKWKHSRPCPCPKKLGTCVQILSLGGAGSSWSAPSRKDLRWRCAYFKGVTVQWVSALCLGKYMLRSDETRASCGPQNHSQMTVLFVKVSKTCSLMTSTNI